ncbi:hypothetical protein [uncultured Cellulomonas sp.]|uniref:hypothetical protein n=1 Tax=uncultured Cellulomonas sp. TaxID=189682 RepID=UPI0028E290CD|nr:hypothetical protein [uncultured Cellulomonas sp.]
MRVSRLLREMAAAEADLAGRLARLADEHSADRDVSLVARDLAIWSQDHAAGLAERAGSRVPDTVDPPPVADDPGATLLRDLREAYLAACGLATDWDVLGQVAAARRDDELAGLVGLCAPRNQRQVTWLRAKRKESAAQIVRR